MEIRFMLPFTTGSYDADWCGLCGRVSTRFIHGSEMCLVDVDVSLPAVNSIVLFATRSHLCARVLC